MSSWRVVQRGRGPLVACYLVGDVCDPDLRTALPGSPIVARSDDPLEPTTADLDRARAPSGASGETVLVGWSGGCQSVRHHVRNGLEVVGVVCLDGTAASFPTPQPWQIDTWTQLALEARRGECVFVATCTQQSYVERLGPTEENPDQHPYMWTRHVLEQAIGLPLPSGAEVHERDMHVFSSPSADIDGAAHIRQVRELMPDLLRTYIAPRLEGRESPVPPPVAFDPGNVGRGILSIAEGDLNMGIREHGFNAGKEIESLYQRPLGFPPGTSYCALAFASWIRRWQEGSGKRAPIKGSPGARATMQQFQAAGLWTPAAKLRADMLRPGHALVWERCDPAKGLGHIGIVHTVGNEVAWTIEANADRPLPCDAVCMVERRLDDAQLLGAGRWVLRETA